MAADNRDRALNATAEFQRAKKFTAPIEPHT
jgi:hypothetical protein